MVTVPLAATSTSNLNWRKPAMPTGMGHAARPRLGVACPATDTPVVNSSASAKRP